MLCYRLLWAILLCALSRYCGMRSVAGQGKAGPSFSTWAWHALSARLHADKFAFVSLNNLLNYQAHLQCMDMSSENLLMLQIGFQYSLFSMQQLVNSWIVKENTVWMIIVVCIIPCIGFKVCQPFSLISPNPPPSQFATFPFAGSGSREQEPDPLPSSILFLRMFSLDQCASANLLVKLKHKLDLQPPPLPPIFMHFLV